MDQIEDEFQMRPMTAGLGFQKKPVSLKDHTKAAQIVNDRIAKSIPFEVPATLGQEIHPRTKEEILNEIKEALQPRPNSKKRLTETLPRSASEVTPESLGLSPEIQVPMPSQISPMDIVSFEIPDITLNETITPAEATRRGAHDSKIREFVPVSFSLSSTVLDAVIVLSLSLIFMISLIFVTGVTLNGVIQTAAQEASALVSLGVLYLSVWQMYVVFARSFFGATLGEWTFDLQLGETEKHSETYYPARVLLRSLTIIFTGFFILPLISLITGRDWAGRFSGLQLYRRNT